MKIENALIKARYVCQETGYPALADDSGLVVPALKGAPGIYSARYAGEKASDEDNTQKLLDELSMAKASDRAATFVCVLVFMQSFEDPLPIIAQGHWQGEILTSSRGSHGFGYDPIFFCPKAQCAASELTLIEKNRCSHRAQALNRLVEQLKRF